MNGKPLTFLLVSAFFCSPSLLADSFKCGLEAANSIAASDAAKASGEIAKAVEDLKEDLFDSPEDKAAALLEVHKAFLDGADLSSGDKAAVRQYLYEIAAGIQPGPKGSWDSFELAPQPDKSLVFVSAIKDTPKGKITSAWAFKEGKCSWTFTIPAETMATVCVNGMCKRYKPGEYTIEVK